MSGPDAGGARAPMEHFQRHLAPLVRSATVRIHQPPGGYPPDGPPLWGSGFFVAPNWVLTCAHVAMRGQGGEVGLTFEGRTVRGRVEWAEPEEGAGGIWPPPDLALVRLLEPVPHACVWLTERTNGVLTSDHVAFFGHTELAGSVMEVDGRCSIAGQLGGGSMVRLGNEDELREGVSGGPLVDVARGEVIGVVKGRRTGKDDGGLAVSVVHLRRLPVPAGPVGREEDDLYQRVVHAHDRHHADRHADGYHLGRTWTDGQGALRHHTDRALTPGRRTALLGLLAELPPPVSTGSLLAVLTEVLGQEPESRPVAPRGWRDGLGLLYDLYAEQHEQSELEHILRYAVYAATAERPYPASEEAERELWEWARDLAADAQLPKVFRNRLGAERSARLRGRPAPGAETGGESVCLGDDPAPRPAVLLDLTPSAWDAESYGWRVSSVLASGDVLPLDEQYDVPADDVRDRLAAPLAEAFRRCDEPGRPATLEVALRQDALDLPVDTWRVPADGPPLGTQRPVVVRCSDRPPPDDEEAEEDERRRWDRLREGPMEPVVLDCVEDRPEPLPDASALRRLGPYTLPVLCRTGTDAGDPGALRKLVAGGFAVALWRREAADPVCKSFHRGTLRTVTDHKRADRLPAAVHRLRAAVGSGVPEAYWSQGVALLHDDPSRPLPGSDDLLETP
ncbi:trypsin-like peptidase domain-containing protein [Streptomyces sp. NPDC048845]|uniref:VMAP-C domain-containing protein n=1 Tax=Streptomyces sp. NPDC048845 TaxID=3155390 RepID=UPI003414F977